MIFDMNDSFTQNSIVNILNDEQIRANIQSKISFMLKPKLSIDGNQWCALYGENLQDGVAGFGDSPDEAYEDFDRNWYKKISDK
jgi:hypothetical protein